MTGEHPALLQCDQGTALFDGRGLVRSVGTTRRGFLDGFPLLRVVQAVKRRRDGPAGKKAGQHQPGQK